MKPTRTLIFIPLWTLRQRSVKASCALLGDGRERRARRLTPLSVRPRKTWSEIVNTGMSTRSSFGFTCNDFFCGFITVVWLVRCLVAEFSPVASKVGFFFVFCLFVCFLGGCHNLGTGLHHTWGLTPSAQSSKICLSVVLQVDEV